MLKKETCFHLVLYFPLSVSSWIKIFSLLNYSYEFRDAGFKTIKTDKTIFWRINNLLVAQNMR